MIRSGIIAAWVLLGIVWLGGALRGKPTVRRESIPQRLLHLSGTALAGFLLISPCHFLRLDLVVLPAWPGLETAGLLVTLAGAAFTILARLRLGTNWSGLVTLKQGHELMRSGPYGIVRHPIYTGLLTCALGTALAWGELRCFAAVLVATLTFERKLRIEERFLLDYFGEDYARYRREVNALIPFFRAPSP